MTLSKHELVLHPIRLRLATELGGRHMTTQQLAAALPDVPQASLYRHIRLLVEGGIIEVMSERTVRGAVERTYGVVSGAERFTPDDIGAMTSEEHLQGFTVYALSLVDEFSRYAAATPPDRFGEEGLSYSRAVLYLTDEERQSLQEAVAALVQTMVSNDPEPGRHRFTLASIVIPDPRSDP